MKNPVPVLLSLLASVLLLGACGQKGPLFLPGTPSTITTPVPEQQPAPDEETDEERDQQNNNPA
jgi:predicted small lipoprotein YifL